MPIGPPITEPALSYKVQDLIADALIEIGALAPSDVANLDPDEAQWAFRKLNYLVDEWQAQEFYVYSYNFTLFTLVAGLSPHTIGPGAGATFSTNQSPRPVRIESAAQLINTGPQTVDLGPINIRDHDWWAQNQVKSIQTNVVTDLYYEPDSPNGSLFFWPVPNAQAQVRLQFWNQVQQFDQILDPIGGPGGPGTLPPAYRAALMYTLAERLLPGSSRQAHPALIEQARKARVAIGMNNIQSPTMSTRDSGMPNAGRTGVRGDFNWFTGGRPGGRPE